MTLFLIAISCIKLDGMYLTDDKGVRDTAAPAVLSALEAWDTRGKICMSVHGFYITVFWCRLPQPSETCKPFMYSWNH